MVGSNSGRVKLKARKVVFVASPLSTHHWLRSKRKDCMVQWTITIIIQLRCCLVQIGHNNYLIECYLFFSWHSWKCAHLSSNNHSGILFCTMEFCGVPFCTIEFCGDPFYTMEFCVVPFCTIEFCGVPFCTRELCQDPCCTMQVCGVPFCTSFVGFHFVL